jgi:hypothetical protein
VPLQINAIRKVRSPSPIVRQTAKAHHRAGLPRAQAVDQGVGRDAGPIVAMRSPLTLIRAFQPALNRAAGNTMSVSSMLTPGPSATLQPIIIYFNWANTCHG